jgi:two-component system CheB/CheR fusion protein
MSKRLGRPAGKSDPLTVVGIGASAGGLEALTRLFRRLRPDLGLAYVAVVHLSPDHSSDYPEILQRAASMPVRPAVDGEALAADHIYVITPNTVLTVANGMMHVEPRAAGPALPIDALFRSIAADQDRRSIAIVLSGAGHDGTEGTKAIKDAGGLVFAQDPATCSHSSMPQSAIDVGSVDFILQPEDISVELERVARHPYLVQVPRTMAPLLRDEESIRRVFAIVRAATGIDFSFYKPTTVGRRLLRRLVLRKVESLSDYIKLLESDPREVQDFAEETLIHVTHFFREPKTFEALRGRILPRILKTLPKDAPLRVWVPGCSTGEEAYSLAICLLDAFGDRANVRRIQIFATDVSEAAITRARLGTYPEGISKDVPPRLLRRFFAKTQRGYQVAKSVRDACIFARQDLTKDPPFANLDLISCRNVLIYLEPPMQRRIMPIFHYALKPTGALMLGSAETIGEFQSLFSVADKNSRIYLKKAAATPPRFDFARTASLETLEMTSKPKNARPAGWPETDVQKAAERALLDRFAPAGVLVNSELDILTFRGAVHRFLKPSSGKASLNLLKMLPTEWHVPLHALLKRAKKTGEPARQDPMTLHDGKGEVVLDVIPIQGPAAGQRCYMILFERLKKTAGPAVRAPRAGGRSDEKLRKELSSTKEYLQAIIEEHEAANEELKAANEEIISSNEELQSTNEELETAKEELQAANEELSTLNEELQTRNSDLGQANNDLVNLLASVHLPIVMLGNDLRIRRFTPLAEKVMNLIPGDIGRPIGDIKPNFEIPNLERLIEGVIETVTTTEVEVRDHEGRWYSLRIRPYKTTENRIEGAVLVLIDTAAIKKAALDLRENTFFSEAVLDMVQEPIVVLDSDFMILSVNPAFKRAFDLGKSPLGRLLFEVAGGRLDLPDLRAALRELAEHGHPFASLELSGSGMHSVASGRRLAEQGQPMSILLTLAFRP